MYTDEMSQPDFIIFQTEYFIAQHLIGERVNQPLLAELSNNEHSQ